MLAEELTALADGVPRSLDGATRWERLGPRYERELAHKVKFARDELDAHRLID